MLPAERMRALLRYANYTHVAQGLTASGYPVSAPTVSRWAQGRNVTELAVRHVEDLLAGTTKDPPAWAEGLIADVDAIRRGVESEAIGLAALRAVLESIESGLLPPAADPVDDPAPPQTARRRGR